MCGFWYLDLDRVQGAFTIRNAGGRAEPALRDLITADGIAGITEIMVVHHTDCGLTYFDNEYFRTFLKQRAAADDDNKSIIDGMDFWEIKNMEQSIKDDVEFLRASPLIGKETKISGHLYDIRTGIVGTIVE
ncbi:hypothetical protein MMC12_003550 [Toensbergia leucococca]|nr:hypothetical protein [Toensbergia leucococca]